MTKIDRETASALSGSAGQIGLILIMAGGTADLPTLIYLSGKTERTVRNALNQLHALHLVTRDGDLWKTIQAVDNPVDNNEDDENQRQNLLQNGADLLQNGTDLLQNGANLLQNGAELPQNYDATYTRARVRVSSSSNTKKESKGEGEDAEPNAETPLTPFQRDPREARALRETLAEAGIGRFSKMMDEILASHWVTPDYAAAHIANMKRRHEPTSYLIRRLLDGDPPPETLWLELATQEIDPPRPTPPHPAVLSDTATSSEDGLPPHPQPPPISNRWKAVLSELKLQMTKGTFDQWLNDAIGLPEGDTLLVILRNDRACEWVSSRLAPTILNTYNALASSPCTSLTAITQAQWATQHSEVTS